MAAEHFLQEVQGSRGLQQRLRVWASDGESGLSDIPVSVRQRAILT